MSIAISGVAQDKGWISRSSSRRLAAGDLHRLAALQQVIRNLLSNHSITDSGPRSLEMRSAAEGWSRHNESLNRADSVVALPWRTPGSGFRCIGRDGFRGVPAGDGTTAAIRGLDWASPSAARSRACGRRDPPDNSPGRAARSRSLAAYADRPAPRRIAAAHGPVAVAAKPRVPVSARYMGPGAIGAPGHCPRPGRAWAAAIRRGSRAVCVCGK